MANILSKSALIHVVAWSITTWSSVEEFHDATDFFFKKELHILFIIHGNCVTRGVKVHVYIHDTRDRKISGNFWKTQGIYIWI